jgi:hypothetical protein
VREDARLDRHVPVHQLLLALHRTRGIGGDRLEELRRRAIKPLGEPQGLDVTADPLHLVQSELVNGMGSSRVVVCFRTMNAYRPGPSGSASIAVVSLAEGSTVPRTKSASLRYVGTTVPVIASR